MFDPKEDIDWSRTIEMAAFHGESGEQFSQRVTLADKGREHLLSFEHCRRVVQMRWGEGSPPHLAAFLCETEPSDEERFERFVWVIVGDVPPMVVSTRRCRNVFQALAEYCDRGWAWVRRVRDSESDDNRVESTGHTNVELAEMLARRLSYIEEIIIEPNRWLLAAPTAADRDRSRGAEPDAGSAAPDGEG